MAKWPSFNDLSPEVVDLVSNGVGADWWPTQVRRKVTVFSGMFFDEADWQHHDYGYFKGGSEKTRWRCDWLFFRAMLRDCKKRWYISPIAVPLSVLFYGSVVIGGAFAFRYGQHKAPEWIVE